MIQISKTIEFDAGHRIQNHQSKCRNPHGHRYKVEVIAAGNIVDDPESPEHGMLKDFSFLKELMMTKVHDVLDHGFVYEWTDSEMATLFAINQDFKAIRFDYPPTAENIARWIWDALAVDVRAVGDVFLDAVIVWETPTCKAIYNGS
jgi:6-pyruvoyltetrahydropterin/6-carboxytetrahydropterin synthase